MDARNLFEQIGRLYAANTLLAEENDRLSKKFVELGKERDQYKEENKVLRTSKEAGEILIEEQKKEIQDLKNRNKSLEWDLESARESCVDARREEDLLADMMGGDPVEEIVAMIPDVEGRS